MKKLMNDAPSSLAKPLLFEPIAKGVVFVNRPYNTGTVPIELLQKEFGQFQDDCAIAPTPESIALLGPLTLAACEWYTSENSRREKISQILKGKDCPTQLFMLRDIDNFQTDGHTYPVVIPASLRDCKNNEGCALFQAIAYYGRFVHKELVDYRKFTRFPCILLTDIGMCHTFILAITANPSRTCFHALRLPIHRKSIDCRATRTQS